ncbi:MAG TPA: FAD binding domain-containing protein [bacterium]|nr:FAD binding domain-containing protein [bacterium]
MLKNLKDYYRPKSLPEALKLLKKGKGKIIPAGGNTALADMENPGIEGLVDIEKAGMSYIKQTGGNINIGAAATITDMIESALIEKFCGGFLRQAALSVGSTLNRNMITVGGNVFQLFLWSSLPVAFLALDAKIKVQGGSKPRLVPAADFFKQLPRKILSSSEMVTEVQIPLAPFKDANAAFIKFSKTATAFPMVNAAVILKLKGKVIDKLAVSIGALQLLPQRFTDIEASVIGKEWDQKTISAIAEEISGRAKILPEIRASAEYKRQVVRATIEDTLASLSK